MFADLHIHSWYSDGTLSPEEIIEKAIAQNITLISISDHETIGAYLANNGLFADEDIKLITGVEIISIMGDTEYHILAYGFNTQDKALNDLLRHNRDILAEKGNKLIEQVSIEYENISMNEFLKYERNRKDGGWESIDYLKIKGIVSDVSDYFKLARKYSIALDKNFLCAARAIEIIHNAGGYAVLAHLGNSAKQDLTACEKVAAQFLDIGIDGFECYYPSHSDEITEFLVKLCREHDLIITAGSDEHGGFNESFGGVNYYIGAVKVKIEQLNLKSLL